MNKQKGIILLLNKLKDLGDIKGIITDYRYGNFINVDKYNKENNILYCKDIYKVIEGESYLIVGSLGGEFDANISSLANRIQIEFKTTVKQYE